MIGFHTFRRRLAEKAVEPLLARGLFRQEATERMGRSIGVFSALMEIRYSFPKKDKRVYYYTGEGLHTANEGERTRRRGRRRALNFTKTKPHFHGEARTLPKSRLKCSCGLCGRPQRSRMEQGKNGGWVEFKNLQRKVDSRRARPFSKSEKKTYIPQKSYLVLVLAILAPFSVE